MQDLRLLEKAGEIRALRLQPRFRLEVNGHHVCDYIGDAHYYCPRRATWILEDVKSPATRTPVYILKKKLMMACLGIEITEVM